MARTGWALGTASSWRAKGWPRLLPVNVTISTNFRCNFKCVSCNVYERKVKELDADEWGQVFASIGKAPAWLTFSGGEPFLRKDLPDIIGSAMRYCQPAIVNIPTNGWFTDRVVSGVEKICKGSPETQLVINLSFDHHVPERHDEIRRGQGSWDRLLKTMAGLRALELPNLTVGCHTVVSKENEHDFPDVARGLRRSVPTPTSPSRPRSASSSRRSGWASRHAAATSRRPPPPCSRTRSRRAARWPDGAALRVEYYNRVTRFLDGDQNAMPVCHAGFLSTHIGADGDCGRAACWSRSFGNLRDVDFDFKRAWFSPEGRGVPHLDPPRRCACPLANATYTNLLVEPGAVRASPPTWCATHPVPAST